MKVNELSLNSHKARHWFVTTRLREIHNIPINDAEIQQRKNELIKYMKWKNPDTMNIYEHYFDEAKHREAHDNMIQNVNVDMVAKLLHQRDLNVTAYYSAPTPSQISESISELHDVISSYVDIDDAYLRSPKELRQQFDGHAEKVGVSNKVLGGTCVTDFVCPTKMQCLGCKAKVPEPDQEDELLKVIQL